ncbi:MAG: NCS2 family permease [Treponema sp.]
MNKLFHLKERGTSVATEIVAGITIFLSMAYILAVNPELLCKAGLDKGAVFTATAVSAAVATLLMGLLANLPIALAPGMGLNAFFTFTVVISMKYSVEVALTAVFLEGILFVIFSLFNVREAILKSIPTNLKKAIPSGIGLFIAFIGLKSAGIIVDNEATLVALNDLTSPIVLLAVAGIILTVLLFALKVPGGILLGILITTIAGYAMKIVPPPTDWKAFSPVSMPHAPTFWHFDFSQVLTFKFFVVFFSFLFVDIFDTVGTFVGVAAQAKLHDKNGNIPKMKQAFLADAVGTCIGAALGTSTVTSYVESTSGVAVGGRTGLTALVISFLFLLSLFFSPLFLLIPPQATASALVMVGFLMMRTIKEVDFSDATEGLPAFLTIIMMPLAYSIAQGIVFGIISYVLLKLLTGEWKKIHPVTAILFLVFVLQFFIK